MSEVRVRFAPSPTGKLHIGGARTAIYNWAFARATGGTFVLRIEDTDPQRSTQDNIDLIIRSMRWLGLDWDEGPEVGGEYGPYLQTQRTQRYRESLDKLITSGAAYPCFCTPEQIAAKRELEQQGEQRVERTCRALSPAEAQRRIEAGEPHVWRLKVPQDRGMVVVHDVVHGDSEFDAALQDDMIIARTDATVTYNFAVVCDDIDMGITHVIRGDDHLSNTPRQILVYEALGCPVPTFAHLPMICGPDGKKLSKRHGAASVEEYRDLGYLPDALFNYLALLGWAPDGQTTIFTRSEMAALFTLERISKNPSSLDPEKLDWVNSQYIQTMGAVAFVEALAPYLVEAGYEHDLAGVKAHAQRYEAFYPLIRERVKLMTEVVAKIAYLLEDSIEFDEQSVKKVLNKEGSQAKSALQAVAEVLGKVEWDLESIEEALRALVEERGVKARFVFQPLRVAVTGSQVSPPLFESIALLARETVLERIAQAVALACD